MTDERAANINDRKIGQKVRSRRLEIGMSQEKLAELLGVTFQQVQKYEKGVNRIAASRLFDIANALDVHVAAFFEGLNGYRVKGNAAELVEPTPEGARAKDIIDRMKKRKLARKIVAIVEEAASL